MKAKKYVENIITCLIAGICISFCVLFFALPKKEYSEYENRYLATLEKPEWENVKTGAYMDDLIDYAVDHFPFRDSFVGIKTESELLLGKKQIGEVYVCADGYYMEVYKPQRETEVRSDILNRFVSGDVLSDKNSVLMLVPTASYVLSEKLPTFYPVPEKSQALVMEEVFEGVNAVKADPTERLLAHKDEYLYYKLDHHWTSLGAYYGYLTYCEAASIEPEALEAFEKEIVSDAFYGTIYSKANDYLASPDTITAYSYPGDSLTVTYDDTEEVTGTLFNPVYLEHKDKYSYFLNNLHSLVTVENDSATSDRVLVLLKDSYANCMVPFLTHHFAKIYIFDTRSYKTGVTKFIEAHPEVTDVLLLYNMNSFDTDLGIRAVY